MPVVPTYDDSQVSDQGTPNVRFDETPANVPVVSGDVGASVAKAGGELAGEAEKFFKTERDNADQVAVLDAKTKASALKTDVLYNPETGALNKFGKDALAARDGVTSYFDQQMSKIEESLNGRQAASFQKVKQAYWEDVDTSLARHESVESKKLDDETTKSFLSNSRTSAAVSYLDAEQTQKSIDEQKEAVAAHAQRNGLPDEMVKEQQTEAASKTYLAVMTRMLVNNQSPLAKQMFERVQDQMDPHDADEIGKAIKHSSILAEAQSTALEIAGKHSNIAGAMSDIDAIENPEVQEKTKELLKERFSLIEQGKKQYSNQLFEAMEKKMEQTQDMVAIQNDPAWYKMEAAQRTALMNDYNRVVKGVDRKNDDEKYTEFMFLGQGALAGLSRSEYVTKYRQYFSNEIQNKADAQIEAAKKGDDKNQLLTQFSSYKERLDDTLRANKIVDPSSPKKTDKDAQLYSQLSLAAMKKVENFETIDLGGKRKATGEEIQKILDGMILQKVRVGGFWGSSEKQTAVLTQDEKGRAFVKYSEIPDGEKSALANQFKSRGKSADPEKMQRAYGAVLVGDKQRLQSILAE